MKPLFFETRNNKYYYDDTDGSIVTIDEKNDYEISNTDNQELTDYSLSEYLEKSGYTQLTLIVTQSCNLRCNYCIYSGNYQNFRTHSNKFMSEKTAIESVRFYMEQSKKLLPNRPLHTPTISFYGGEPLLNFSLIKTVVEYTEENYGKENVLFSMTTNLTLANDDIISFFIEHNFAIAVSLNGNKVNNDRMRVTQNGQGTFDIIYKRLRRINMIDENFFRNNVSIIVTYDKKTDMIALDDFFNSDPLLKDKLAMALSVKETFLSSDLLQENDIYIQSMNKLEKNFIEKAKNKQYNDITILQKVIFGTPLIAMFDRSRNIKMQNIIPYTSMCVPGTKIAVDVDGSFHCCEKVNEKKPFGNSYSGIDFEKVNKYIKELKEFGKKHCQQCKIKRMCTLCFADMIADDGTLVLPDKKYCIKLEEAVAQQLTLYCTLVENGVDIKKLQGGDNI